MNKRASLFLLISLVVSAPLPRELGLKELLAVAMERNEDVIISDYRFMGEQEGSKGAYSAFLPSVNLGVTNRVNDGGSYLFPVAGANDYSGSLTISQPLFDASAWFRAKNVENDVLLSETSRRSTREGVILSVSTAYYNYLLLLELEEVARFSEELASSQLNLVQRQYELQAVSETDLLKAKVLKGQAEAQRIQAAQNVRTALNALRVAIGETAGYPLKVRHSEVILRDVPDFETAKEELLRNNSQLELIRYQAEGARLAYNTQSAIFYPRISLTTSYNSINNGLEGIYDDFTATSPTTSLSVSVPLFAGFTRSSSRNKLKYNVLSSEANISKMEKDLSAQLDDLLLQLKTYHDLLPINEDIIRSAESDMALAEERYNLGASDILDLLNAQVSLIRAKSELVKLKYNAKIAETRLDVLLGRARVNPN